MSLPHEVNRYLRMGKQFLISVRQNRFSKEEEPLLGYRKQFDYGSSETINEYQIFNCYYGISNLLQQYSRFDKPIAASIEHGVYFGIGDSGEVEKYNLPCVVTMGSYRKLALSTTRRPIVPIGPYIAYAKCVLDETAFKKYKEALGKVLLVFPYHSTHLSGITFDVNYLIESIEEAKRRFGIQTVLVCLYFNDVSRHSATYEQAGYTVVCAGYRTQTAFLNRLRTYIELADFVLTNSIGTHVGYCLYMSKPVSYIKQEIEKTFKSEKDEHKVNPFGSNISPMLDQIESCFKGYSESITNEQLASTEPFWGYRSVRTPEELNCLFVHSRAILKKYRRDCVFDELWIKEMNGASDTDRELLRRLLVDDK